MSGLVVHISGPACAIRNATYLFTHPRAGPGLAQDTFQFTTKTDDTQVCQTTGHGNNNNRRNHPKGPVLKVSHLGSG